MHTQFFIKKSQVFLGPSSSRVTLPPPGHTCHSSLKCPLWPLYRTSLDHLCLPRCHSGSWLPWPGSLQAGSGNLCPPWAPQARCWLRGNPGREDRPQSSVPVCFCHQGACLGSPTLGLSQDATLKCSPPRPSLRPSNPPLLAPRAKGQHVPLRSVLQAADGRRKWEGDVWAE